MRLSTSPLAPPTHWLQSIFYLGFAQEMTQVRAFGPLRACARMICMYMCLDALD